MNTGSFDTHGHWLSVEPFAYLVNILSLNPTLIHSGGQRAGGDRASEIPQVKETSLLIRMCRETWMWSSAVGQERLSVLRPVIKNLQHVNIHLHSDKTYAVIAADMCCNTEKRGEGPYVKDRVSAPWCVTWIEWLIHFDFCRRSYQSVTMVTTFLVSEWPNEGNLKLKPQKEPCCLKTFAKKSQLKVQSVLSVQIYDLKYCP